jgi:hypothetical protein
MLHARRILKKGPHIHRHTSQARLNIGAENLPYNRPQNLALRE